MASDLMCPYCSEFVDFEADDPAFYQEDNGVPLECSECGKTFLVYGRMSWDFEGEQADCLNGEPHAWSNWRKMWQEDDEKSPNFGKYLCRRSCEWCEKGEQEWRASAS